MATRSIPRENPVGDRTGKVVRRGLGWFGVGLGLAELVAPDTVARLAGLDGGRVRAVTRALGARELGSGLVLLEAPASPAGSWSRVVGDLIDLAALAYAMKQASVAPRRTMLALGTVLGVTALDVLDGVRQSRRALGEPVFRSITIAREPREVYARWRDLERIPEWMSWVETVRDLGGGISRWRVTPIGCAPIEYDVELVEDLPGRRIAWRSVEGSKLPNTGSVTFLDAPGGRGTEVILEMRVAARLGKTIAGADAMGDLRRLKQLLEIGEELESDAG